MEQSGTPEFSYVKRGYDPDEVERHLRDQAAAYERRLAEITTRLDATESKLAEAMESEEAVHLTLVAATRTKDEMLGQAQQALDKATAEAEQKAEKIVSDAKFQAYRMVTDAQSDAENALTEATEEARRITSKAKIEASTMIKEAEHAAASNRSTIEAETKELLAVRHAELERLSEEFEERNVTLVERVHRLGAVANALEAQLQAVAKGTLEDLSGIAAEFKTAMADNPRVNGSRYPSPEHRSDSSTRTNGSEEVRGSFYSRRSAGLPRIGEVAAGDAMVAINNLRTKTFAELSEVEGDDVDDEAESLIEIA